MHNYGWIILIVIFFYDPMPSFSVPSRVELDKPSGSSDAAWRMAVSSIRPFALVRTGRRPFNSVSNIRVRQNHRQRHRLQQPRRLLQLNNHPLLPFSPPVPFRRLLWLWPVSAHSQWRSTISIRQLTVSIRPTGTQNLMIFLVLLLPGGQELGDKYNTLFYV